MVSLQAFLLIYLFGGLTLIPTALLIFIVLFTRRKKENVKNCPTELYEDVSIDGSKKGWILLSNECIGKKGISAHWNSSKPKRSDYAFYGVLNKGTLYLYESDDEQTQKDAIIVFDYQVSIYPEGRSDADIYGRSSSICLRRKRPAGKQGSEKSASQAGSKVDSNSPTSGNDKSGPEETYYLTCARAIDKEDWYLALTSASHLFSDVDYVEMVDKTHFDSYAMEELIARVMECNSNEHKTSSKHDTDWFNAVIGRLFLSTYKTDKIKDVFEAKVIKKIQKLKGTFWENVRVSNVNVGDSIPCIKEPKLLSLRSDGNLMIEASMTYTGEAEVEITLDAKVIPSAPELTLKLRLCHFSGRFMLKIKPPPSNRVWIGFYEKPEMEWDFDPTVNDTSVRRMRNTIKNALNNKILASLEESMVLPNMEDIAFFDSDGRGGIFGERVPVTRHVRNHRGRSDVKSSPSVPERESGHATDTLQPPKRRAVSEVPGMTSKSSPELNTKTAADGSSIRSNESQSTSSSSSMRAIDKTLTRRKKSGSNSSSETDDTSVSSKRSIKAALWRKIRSEKDVFSSFLKKKTSSSGYSPEPQSSPLIKPQPLSRKPMEDTPPVIRVHASTDGDTLANAPTAPTQHSTKQVQQTSSHSSSELRHPGPPPPPRRPVARTVPPIPSSPHTKPIQKEAEFPKRDKKGDALPGNQQDSSCGPSNSSRPSSPDHHNHSVDPPCIFEKDETNESDGTISPASDSFQISPSDPADKNYSTDGASDTMIPTCNSTTDSEHQTDDLPAMQGSQCEQTQKKLNDGLAPPLPPRKDLPCME